MKSEATKEEPSTARKVLKTVLYSLTALWIFLGSFLYYTRFSYAFYLDHESDIHQLIARLTELLGANP